MKIVARLQGMRDALVDIGEAEAENTTARAAAKSLTEIIKSAQEECICDDCRICSQDTQGCPCSDVAYQAGCEADRKPVGA